MGVLGKDSLFESSASVNLTAHSPSGTGAAGGAWSYVSGSSGVLSAAGGGFKPSGAGNSYQAGNRASGNAYCQVSAIFVGGSYGGAYLLSDPTVVGGSGYLFNRNGGSGGTWEIQKYSGTSGSGASVATLATISASFADATSYLLRFERVISGSNVILTAYINGTQVGTVTDSGSPYLGQLYGGFNAFSPGSSTLTLSAFESGTFAPALLAGTSSTTSSGNQIASVAVTGASGGAGPYTYQWYRSTTSGFTPGSGNLLAGATSLTLNDTGLTNGTTYYYVCVAMDSAAATAASNQTAATPSSSGSISASPSTIYTSANQVEIVLTGTGTTWSGSTAFAVSGSGGSSIASSVNVSGTKQYLKLIPGTTSGTLTVSDGSLSVTITVAAGSIVPPNNSKIRHLGPTNVTATEAISVTSGPAFECVFTGDSALLLFNATGAGGTGPVTVFPDLIYQVDRDPVVRTSVAPGVPIVVSPLYTSTTTVKASQHNLKAWWAVFEGAGSPQPTVNKWTSLLSAARFGGMMLPGSGALVTLPAANPNAMLFVGDSLTESVRGLYTGSTSDQTVEIPHIAWPQQVADRIGFAPIVLGYGGTGVTAAGSGGVPAAPSSLGLSYSGVTYTPAFAPSIAVVYHGTNDGGASSAAFQAAYVNTLNAVRSLGSGCLIFAINPHPVNRLADITAAVATSGLSGVTIADATTAGLTGSDLSDGTHLSPGGNNKLAVWVAGVISTQLGSLGWKSRPITAGGGVPTIGKRLIS